MRARNASKNQNRLRDEDIERIYKAYKDRKDISKYSKAADLKDIEENEYNLNIPRYIDSFEDEDNVDLKSIREEISKLEAERDSLDSSIAKILKDIKL